MRHLSLVPHCFTALVLLALSGSAVQARANVISITVQNGSFEDLTVAGASNQLGYHVKNGTTIQQATGWTNQSSGGTLGYNFVFSGSSTTSGTAYGSAYGNSGSLALWGIENGVANGIGVSPDGGNFLAMDGAYQQATVTQQLTGLTVGMDTKVYFYYAGAQQSGFNGATTEGFQVGLSDGITSQTQTTAILNNENHGFTGWKYTYMDFVPTSTTETLSFLAVGTPGGVPPFSLLDGVTVVQVTPEPSTLMLLGTGVLTTVGLLRRRRTA